MGPETIDDASLSLYLHTLRDAVIWIGHTSFLTSMVQLPDGRLLTGAGDKELRIWDLDHYSCTTVLTGHTGAVRCIVLLENGEALATGADDNNVIIWCAGIDLT